MLKLIGIALLCIFVILDAFVRFRVKSIGQKWAFLRGGSLDYREYLKARERHDWPAWPVYAIWLALIAGIAMFVAGVIVSKGQLAIVYLISRTSFSLAAERSSIFLVSA